MDQHNNHLKFLKENDMYNEQEKMDSIQSVKDIYAITSNSGAVSSSIIRDNSNTNLN